MARTPEARPITSNPDMVSPFGVRVPGFESTACRSQLFLTSANAEFTRPLSNERDVQCKAEDDGVKRKTGMVHAVDPEH